MEPDLGPIAVILDLSTLDHLRCLEAKGLWPRWRGGEDEPGQADRVRAPVSRGRPRVKRVAALFSDLPATAQRGMSRSPQRQRGAAHLQLGHEAPDGAPRHLPRILPLHRRCDPRRPAEDSFESGAIKGTNLLKYHLRPLSRLGLDNPRPRRLRRAGTRRTRAPRPRRTWPGRGTSSRGR